MAKTFSFVKGFTNHAFTSCISEVLPAGWTPYAPLPNPVRCFRAARFGLAPSHITIFVWKPYSSSAYIASYKVAVRNWLLNPPSLL